MAWINHIIRKGNKDSHQNTIVSNDIIEIFPKPNEKTLSLIQKVPQTSKILFLYKQEKGISAEWKSWAWEMMENGYDTPSIIQLAGENLCMNPFEFTSLANNIFKELEVNVTTDDAYYQYVLGIARQVLKDEMSAEKGFKILTQAAIDTNYHDAFMEFYYLEENADLLRDHLPGCYGDGSMREDNIEEWMHMYFEKLIMIND